MTNKFDLIEPIKRDLSDSALDTFDLGYRHGSEDAAEAIRFLYTCMSVSDLDKAGFEVDYSKTSLSNAIDIISYQPIDSIIYRVEKFKEAKSHSFVVGDLVKNGGTLRGMVVKAERDSLTIYTTSGVFLEGQKNKAWILVGHCDLNMIFDEQVKTDAE